MKFIKKIWTLLFVSAYFFSCKEKEVKFQQNNCKKNPAFVQALGFNQAKSFFSTSDIKTMGLLLMESSQPGNPAVAATRVYQHPSWTKGGWLAPVLVDNAGNIFTAPAPFINVLNNPASNQNTIYKVDYGTGVMDEFMRLPVPDTNSQNAYGIIGMAYLCETNTLYVSTVAGSDRLNERGAIYAINPGTQKVIDKISNFDAMGMGITYITGERKLFFGNGRNSDIFSVGLTDKGKFSSSPRKEFTLANLGPRGDDKVRRITTDAFGNLNITGMEFNFNLVAPREKQQATYQYFYSSDEKVWIVKAIL
jgi:hypothetical protein